MVQPVESPSGPLLQQTLPFPRSFPSLFFLIDPFYWGACGEIIIILFCFKFIVDLFYEKFPIVVSINFSEVSTGELELVYFLRDFAPDISPMFEIPAAVELSISLLLLAGVLNIFSDLPSFKVLLLPISLTIKPTPPFLRLVLVSLFWIS